MENSPLKLLVTIIVAAALIYLAIGYFAPPNDKNLDEVKNGLAYAQANEGELHKIELFLQKDFALKGSLLDDPSRSVRFECTSSQTCSADGIEIDPRQVFVTEQGPHEIYFRCKNEGEIDDCVIYFGQEPAQLLIERVNVTKSAKRGEVVSISFEIKNTGNLTAHDLTHEVKIYLKNKDENGRQIELLSQNFTGTIETLLRNESTTILRQFSPTGPGKYSVKIIADGEISGRSVAEDEFEVIESISQSCTATSIGKTTLENGVCKTEHLCSGCEFGFECSTKWKERGIENISESFPNTAYTQKEPIDGQCQ